MSQVFTQDISALDQSLVEPFVVDLAHVYSHRLTRGELLSASLETTVLCPSEMSAVIRFVSYGETMIELNGMRVEEALVETPATDPPPFFQYTRTTEAVRLHQGANHMRMQPGQGRGLHGFVWHCAAAFADLEGHVIGGLAFEV